MKKNILKKTCIATAIMLSAVCSTSSFAVAEQTASVGQSQAYTSELNRMSRLQVQEWVEGLQTAFPYYKIQLKSFEEQGENAVAVIEFAIGNPANAAEGIYLALNYEVKIEHGLAFEDRKISIARLETDTSVSEASSPIFFEAFNVVSEFLERVDLQGLTIMRPSGELYSQIHLGTPFEYVEDSVSITVPTLEGEFETYDGAQLVRGNLSVPSISMDNTHSDRHVIVSGITANIENKPIRNAIYDLNGQTEFRIASISATDEGKTLFSLKDFVYRDDTKVDEKGLIQGQFSMSGNGDTPEINYGLIGEGQEPGSISFDFVINGQLSNLSAANYVRLMQRQYNEAPDFDGVEVEALIFDLLKDGPQLDFDQIDVTLNGDKGRFTAHIGLQPLTERDRKAQLYLLLLQKVEASATADMPLKWFELFIPDAQERNEFVSELTQTGYFTLKDGRLQSSFSYNQGNILINGKPLDGGLPF